MTYVLIHNPGCGSSKKGLQVLQDAGIDPEIRKYMLKASRLSEDELRGIAQKMGNVSPRQFWREKDAASDGLGPQSTDDEIFAAMAANPKIIQRPIGVNGSKAVLGRPNQRLLEIA